MFRRTKSSEQSSPETATEAADATKAGGKGRPTPTRKEAEAARRERAKASAAGRARPGQKLTKAERAEQRAKIRAGMRSGDERYLMPRDQGPVRRFIRDRVDTRLSAAEFLLPLLIVVMFLQYSPAPQLRAISNSLWATSLAVVLLDTTFLMLRVRRELAARFPDTSHKGWWGYLLLRAMQLRFLRLPKPRYKLGETLPEHYR